MQMGINNFKNLERKGELYSSGSQEGFYEHSNEL
jgi:hypothetical protein